MKKSSPHRPPRSNCDPRLQLLRRVARAADAIARSMRRTRATRQSDARVWAEAERRILGDHVSSPAGTRP